MQSKTVNPILQWWMTPRLPFYYVYLQKQPQGLYNTLRVYFRHFLVHPLKRRLSKTYLWVLQNFFGLKVIAITGSAGKTTTKEMITSILRQDGETVATFANIDPVFNIPTTILKCKPSTKYLVLEMGIEQPREMSFYLWFVKPTIAVVTNVYQTHTQFFRDLKGVAREKEYLIKNLPENSFAVLNKENKFTQKMTGSTQAKVVWYGDKAGVTLQDLHIDLKGTSYTLITNSGLTNVHLPLIGKHFASNSLAAAAVGQTVGLSLAQIKKGIETSPVPEHRMTPIKLKNGAVVIDDTYNNNPEAAKSTLGTVAKIKDKRKLIIVFGDMLELGKTEVEEHRKIGEFMARLPVDALIGVGALSRFTVEAAARKQKQGTFTWCETPDEAFSSLLYILNNETQSLLVLVKGSRSIGLDKLVAKLH